MAISGNGRDLPTGLGLIRGETERAETPGTGHWPGITEENEIEHGGSCGGRIMIGPLGFQILERRNQLWETKATNA